MHQENGELWYNINTSRVHLSDDQALAALTGQALSSTLGLFYALSQLSLNKVAA